MISQIRILVSIFIPVLLLLLLFCDAGVGHSLSYQHENPQINFIVGGGINSNNTNLMEVNNTSVNVFPLNI